MSRTSSGSRFVDIAVNPERSANNTVAFLRCEEGSWLLSGILGAENRRCRPESTNGRKKGPPLTHTVESLRRNILRQRRGNKLFRCWAWIPLNRDPWNRWQHR